MEGKRDSEEPWRKEHMEELHGGTDGRQKDGRSIRGRECTAWRPFSKCTGRREVNVEELPLLNLVLVLPRIQAQDSSTSEG